MTGGARSGLDGPACRDPGGRKRDPALAAVAREVAQAPAHPPRGAILAAVDARAGVAPDGQRLCRDRTVPAEEHSRAVARALRRTLHRRARAQVRRRLFGIGLLTMEPRPLQLAGRRALQ